MKRIFSFLNSLLVLAVACFLLWVAYQMNRTAAAQENFLTFVRETSTEIQLQDGSDVALEVQVAGPASALAPQSKQTCVAAFTQVKVRLKSKDSDGSFLNPVCKLTEGQKQLDFQGLKVDLEELSTQDDWQELAEQPEFIPPDQRYQVEPDVDVIHYLVKEIVLQEGDTLYLAGTCEGGRLAPRGDLGPAVFKGTKEQFEEHLASDFRKRSSMNIVLFLFGLALVITGAVKLVKAVRGQ